MSLTTKPSRLPRNPIAGIAPVSHRLRGIVGENPTVARRKIGYVVTFAALAIAFLGARASRWQGDTELHTLMEVIATFLAINVGVLALVRFYSQKDNTFLFIGAGFLGTGFLDGYHTLVTWARFAAYFPSTPPSLIPWSWLASRLFLSVALCLSWLFWLREETLGEAGRVNEKTVYAVFTALTLGCFLFFVTVPLPSGYRPGWLFPRPQEFVPAILFALALFGYLRKGQWRSDSFEHWLVLSLIVGFLSQAAFMSSSSRLYDAMFDQAHLLKQTSYVCVLVGLLINMYRLFWLSAGDPILIQNVASNAFVSVNERLASLFGYSREQMLKLDLQALSADAPPWTAAETTRLLEGLPIDHPMTVEWHCRARDGRLFWAEVDLQRGTFARQQVLLLRIHDITERKRSVAALAYRDQVLHAVTVATADLVAGESPERGIAKGLRTVGEAINVDRVLVIENNLEPDTPPLLRHVWQAPEVAVKMDQATLLVAGPDKEETADSWLAPLRQHKPVVTKFHSADGWLRAMMERLQNKSMLLLPIFIGERLWGSVGVDDCRIEREWTATEIDALMTFAELIGVVTMRNDARLSLEKSEQRFRTVAETAQDAIILINAVGSVEYWNPAAERVLGYAEGEAMAQDVERWLGNAADDLKKFAATGQSDLAGKIVEMTARRKDGAAIPVELSIAGMRIDSEFHIVVILRDVTERKDAEKQITHLAQHDTLTGLPNRAAFIEELEHAIARSRRSGEGFALLYLDLDHFKDVNDTLGHPTGDLLLKEIAKRLRSAVREADLVARLGGDEFALIETDIREPLDAAILAEKLLRRVADVSIIRGNEIRIGTSIGITVYLPDDDATGADALLSHADVALYRAKSEGRASYRFFTEAMDVEVRKRVVFGAELRQAITQDQLFLVYQPQVDVLTHSIIGVEALARWRRPDHRLVLPGEFIAIAEQTGLIIALGQWVRRAACRQVKQWIDAGIVVPLIAVNLSALEFRSPLELEKDIDGILAETGLPPQKLELELTESALMDASQRHNETLQRLRKKGIRIAIDDFGTGYSSLDYLRRFPVDRLKVAQSFIVDMERKPEDAVIAKAAIGLALDLNIDAVAEGVETEQQLKLITSWGCHHIQGYYFSEPLPADEMSALLRTGKIEARDQGRRPQFG